MLINSNILVSSEGIITLQKYLFAHIFYGIEVLFLLRNNESNSDNKNQHDI